MVMGISIEEPTYGRILGVYISRHRHRNMLTVEIMIS